MYAGNLRINGSDYGNTLYQNGWQVCKADYVQAALRIYNNSNLTNNFDIDIFDTSPEEMQLDQDDVRVYINAQLITTDSFTLNQQEQLQHVRLQQHLHQLQQPMWMG